MGCGKPKKERLWRAALPAKNISASKPSERTLDGNPL